MYLIFSVLGLLGGLLCCVGDVLFDLKGRATKSWAHRRILTVTGQKWLTGDSVFPLPLRW